jgi:hypothetical protein
VQRLELGYNLSGNQLNLEDAMLDGNAAHEDSSSVRTLSVAAPVSFSSLIRGGLSLGTLYAANGLRSLPSSAEPRPGGDAYFSGGDNTRRHGCGAGAGAFGGVSRGNICGVQIEANLVGVRDTELNRQHFGDVTAAVLEQYLSSHFNIDLSR